MGDGGGEAGPELLVGGELAGRAQVDERLLALAERVGDLDRRPPAEVEQLVREDGALDEPVERLAGAPARGDDAARLVEDDDDLAALLDQGAGAVDVRPRRLGRLRGARRAARETLHQIVTRSITGSLRRPDLS